MGSIQTRVYVDIAVFADSVREGTETFGVRITSVSPNVPIEDGDATVRIGDNEPPISLSVDDVSVTEGNSSTRNATFTVRLSRALASGQIETVNYATRDVTATSSDYSTRSGALSFSGTTTTATVAVPVIGDRTTEPNETFELVLSSPSGVADVVDDVAVGTIVNDDGTASPAPPPAFQVEDAGVVEPASGTAQLRFRIWLSSAASGPMSVVASTDPANSTATAGSDYTAVSQTASFAKGATQAFVDVPVNADALNEAPEERVGLKLSSPSNAVLADTGAVGRIVDATWRRRRSMTTWRRAAAWVSPRRLVRASQLISTCSAICAGSPTSASR